MDLLKKDKDCESFCLKVNKKKMIFKHKRQIYVTFYDHSDHISFHEKFEYDFFLLVMYLILFTVIF